MAKEEQPNQPISAERLKELAELAAKLREMDELARRKPEGHA